MEQGEKGHEEEIHGSTDSICPAASSIRDTDWRDYLKDGSLGCDVLQMEKAVCKFGSLKDPQIEAAGRRQQTAEIAGGRSNA